MPAGRNEISKWTKTAAEKAGLNSKKFKFTNHSHRATSVSHLAKSGVGENQLIKITGHGNVNSIKPYLQLDQSFHEDIIHKMRGNHNAANNGIQNCNASPVLSSAQTISTSNSVMSENNSSKAVFKFENCVFNCHNFNNN